MALAAALTLAACASARTPSGHDDHLTEALLPPSSLGGSLSLSQRVVGEFEGQKWSFRVEADVTPTQLTMIALSPLGIPLFSLEQSSEAVIVETFSPEPLPFDPRFILLDFQLAHWPTTVLKAKFISLGLHLEAERSGGWRKLLGKSNELLAEVSYRQGTSDGADIIIEHFDFSYRLEIETLKSHRASRPAP